MQNFNHPFELQTDKTTIIKFKRLRTEDPFDSFGMNPKFFLSNFQVIETKRPEKKIKQIHALTQALESIKVANELKKEFNELNRNYQNKKQDLEKQPIKKFFQFIGSEDDGIENLVTQLQNGEKHKNEVSEMIYQKYRQEIRIENKLENIQLENARLKIKLILKNLQKQTPGNVNLLELIENKTPIESKPNSNHLTSLPIVHCARKLKLDSQIEQDEKYYTTDYYIMNEQKNDDDKNMVPSIEYKIC